MRRKGTACITRCSAYRRKSPTQKHTSTSRASCGSDGACCGSSRCFSNDQPRAFSTTYVSIWSPPACSMSRHVGQTSFCILVDARVTSRIVKPMHATKKVTTPTAPAKPACESAIGHRRSRSVHTGWSNGGGALGYRSLASIARSASTDTAKLARKCATRRFAAAFGIAATSIPTGSVGLTKVP